MCNHRLYLGDGNSHTLGELLSHGHANLGGAAQPVRTDENGLAAGQIDIVIVSITRVVGDLCRTGHSKLAVIAQKYIHHRRFC